MEKRSNCALFVKLLPSSYRVAISNRCSSCETCTAFAAVIMPRLDVM
jgi:hypothetical protein